MALTWDRTHEWDGGKWRTRAACRDSDPELFFPIGSTGTALEQIRAAKEVCARCSMRKPCLHFPRATNQEAGVWGGLSEDERRRLRRGQPVTLVASAK